MNKIFLIGNLTRDPELSETPSGIPVCRFSIAVNRNQSSADGERITDFFNCTAWRALGETIARYCRKGNKVSVVGSVQIRNYEDSTGAKRTAVDVICSDVEFLTPKSQQSDDFGGYDVPSSAPVRKSPSAKPAPALQPFDEDDGDIPF